MQAEPLIIEIYRTIYMTYAEPERKNQIWPVGVEIRELRKRNHKKMKATNTPRIVWYYLLVQQSNIRQLLPRDKLRGRIEM